MAWTWRTGSLSAASVLPTIGQPSSPGRWESGWRCGFVRASDVGRPVTGMAIVCLHTPPASPAAGLVCSSWCDGCSWREAWQPLPDAPIVRGNDNEVRYCFLQRVKAHQQAAHLLGITVDEAARQPRPLGRQLDALDLPGRVPHQY